METTMLSVPQGVPVKQMRQGDVFLEYMGVSVKGLDLKHQERKTGEPVILAYGEVTGHAHRILNGAEMLLAENGERYVQATKEAALVHEEHYGLPVQEGFWHTWIQKEYSPAEIRNVAD